MTYLSIHSLPSVWSKVMERVRQKMTSFFNFLFQYCRPFPAASVRRILRYIIHFYREHDNLRKMVLTVSFKRRVGDTPNFVTCAFHHILRHYFRGLLLPIGFFLVSNFSLDTAQEISIQNFRLNLHFSSNWHRVVRENVLNDRFVDSSLFVNSSLYINGS